MRHFRRGSIRPNPGRRFTTRKARPAAFDLGLVTAANGGDPETAFPEMADPCFCHNYRSRLSADRP